MKTILSLSVTLCVTILAACSSSNTNTPTAPVQQQSPFLTATFNGVPWTASIIEGSYGNQSAVNGTTYFTVVNAQDLTDSAFVDFLLTYSYDPGVGAVGFDTTTQWQIYNALNIKLLSGPFGGYYPDKNSQIIHATITNDTIMQGTIAGTFVKNSPPYDSVVITNGSFRVHGTLHQ